MATNGLLIEFGVDRPMSPDDMQKFESVLGTLQGWKSGGVIEDFRYHAIVTGNRTERIGMIMLETSAEQLEALVSKKEYGEFHDSLLGMCTNLTSNRAITLERMMQLMKQ